MELLQLEHFLAVLEERTFTRAAERVGRTQSAVSQSIKKLEETLGTPLFSRDVHEVSLTDAGRALAEYARRMVRARDHAVRQIGALRDLKLGTLKIAALDHAAVYLLRAPLHAYLTSFPNIKVTVLRGSPARIPRQVLNREVHIGFVEDAPVFRELKAVEVHCDRMVLIASPRHPLAARQQVDISDLDGERFVQRRMCGTSDQMVARLFAAHETRRCVVGELSSVESIKSLVAGGIALAIVPRSTVTQELSDRTLVSIRVRELNLRRRTLMIFGNQDYLSEPARELIKIVLGFEWKTAIGVNPRAFLRGRAGRPVPQPVDESDAEETTDRVSVSLVRSRR